jgi:hypothetical protein
VARIPEQRGDAFAQERVVLGHDHAELLRRLGLGGCNVA